MPVYEFFCEDCEQKFEVVATLQEKEAGLKPVCPRCGCTRVHQVFGRFTVIGGSKGDIDTDLPDIGDEDFGAGSEDDFEDEGFDDLTDTDEDLDEDLDID
uniref:Zinc ribbon domain-containing protein n=1 Tax=candidate division WOR-3 bacterium TaxID=2052148 RepID=A0A7V3PT49_UNCW3